MAEHLYAKALALDPQLGSAHASLINHLHWMNQSQSALDHANAALALRPSDVNILRARAGALLYLKRPDEASRQVQDLARLMGTSIQDDWVLAAAELMRGNADAASRLATIIERGPVILRRLDTARLYGLINDPRTAARHLEHAFRGEPSCVMFIDQSPAFAAFRPHPAIQEVMNKYRVP